MKVKWIGKINWGKVFLIGILYTALSMVVRQVEMLWTMKYYVDPAYFGVWNKLMMPSAGPPPPEFFIVSAIITLSVGMSLTIIYYYLKEYLPKGYIPRSFFFADLMVATSFIFFTLPTFLMFNVPYALLASWFVSTFVIILVSSLTIVKIVGK